MTTPESPTKEQIDEFIGKLSAGFTIIKKRVSQKEHLLSIGQEIMSNMFSLVAEDEELMAYTITQLLIRAPHAINELKYTIEMKYPHYKDKLNKLLLLI